MRVCCMYISGVLIVSYMIRPTGGSYRQYCKAEGAIAVYTIYLIE